MATYILDLNSSRALDPALAGGKGASLAWLRSKRFDIPPGFVLTTAAFAAAMAALPPADALPAGAAESPVPVPVPSDVERAVRQAYRRLGGRVAIRSSMVEEDGTAASYAGQLETVLDVDGEDAVLRAVQTCWASAFGAQVTAYAQARDPVAQQGQPPADEVRPHFAVVIQRMVPARTAGVAFSADPITGQRCVVVEAVHGLGDSLVRGLAEPDRFLVDSRGIVAEVKHAHPDAPTLAEREVLALAELVRRVARASRHPQDIEWAWDGAQFYLLQCRAITSLIGRHVYSNRMVSDMSPGLIKPLVYSTNTVGKARNVFGRLFTELIGPNEFDFTRLAVRIHSRVYTDLTMLGELLERVGLPGNFLEVMTRDEQSEARRLSPSFQTARAMLRLMRFAWRHSRPAAEIQSFLEDHDRILQTYENTTWQAVDPPELLVHLDSLIAHHAQSQWYVFIGPMNMMVRNRILNQWVKRRTADLVPSDLLRGLVGLKALEPNAGLQRLAALARQLEDDERACLADGDIPTIYALLEKSETGRALIRGVGEFLDKYGFLSSNGTDFTETPWSENEGLIWSSIGRAAENPRARSVEDVRMVRERARERIRGQLGFLQRRFFDRLLASTIAYIDLRERVSLVMSKDSYQMRRILLALGERLVQQGDLDNRDDLFYLTRDELHALAEGDLASAAAKSLITARKAAMEADAQVEPPGTICGDTLPMPSALATHDQDYLTGISGSSGWACGRARIILDPAKAPTRLNNDDVLIVPFSDVGWTPLFAGISGIVAETGGQLSHTSIVAREYGIPAVVSVKQATHLIRDGQSVAVDGTRGRVYLRHLAKLREEP